MVFLVRSKKGVSFLVEILIVLVIGLAVAAVFLIVIPRETAKTGKLSTCSVFSFGEQNRGYCVAKDIDCSGTVNTIAVGCPKETPVCCIGEVPAETPAASEGGAPGQKKGAVQLSMKAKLDNQGYLIIGDRFDPFPIGAKAQGADGKTRKETSLDMNVAGTQDIKYCIVEMSATGVKNTFSGDCASDKWKTTPYKFLNLGDYTLKITGYDNNTKDKVKIDEKTFHIRVE